ncbi:MAG: hypothetical protein WAL51_12575, partial [Candidatus Acidiferrales bacterium]
AASSAKASAVAPTLAPTSAAPSAGSASLSEADQAIQSTMNTLKDALFRLELRRQSGALAEEEYERERARLEKVLRDLVRS